MFALYLLICIVGLAACALWAWFCYTVFWPKKKISLENPYIRSHELKIYNDQMYEEYEDWMKSNGHGVPIPKIQSPEDIEAEKKIKRLTL